MNSNQFTLATNTSYRLYSVDLVILSCFLFAHYVWIIDSILRSILTQNKTNILETANEVFFFFLFFIRIQSKNVRMFRTVMYYVTESQSICFFFFIFVAFLWCALMMLFMVSLTLINSEYSQIDECLGVDVDLSMLRFILFSITNNMANRILSFIKFVCVDGKSSFNLQISFGIRRSC